MKTLSVQSTITISLLCLAGFLLWPLMTYGFFSSAGEAGQNNFSLATLETAVSPASVAEDIAATATTSVVLGLTDIGSLPAQYQLTTEIGSCAPVFYNGLEAVVSVGVNTIATASLSSLVAVHPTAAALTLDITTTPSWIASDAETCTFDIVITAWQGDFADMNQGFSDEVRVPVTLTADVPAVIPVATNVVLNEIYPAPLATTTVPLEREWIELYNGTGAPIDVANWVISEFVGGDPLNTERPHTIVSSCVSPVSVHMQPVGGGSTVVPAGGYLLVEFCGVAEYLHNSGDTVILYDDTSALIDSHAYPATVPGKSHARIPDGGTWVDPVPTPGGFNTATEADLAAEGWSPDLIEETLSELERLQSQDESAVETEEETGQFGFAVSEVKAATTTKSAPESLATTSTSTTATTSSTTAATSSTTKDTTTDQTSAADAPKLTSQPALVVQQTTDSNNDEVAKDNSKDNDDTTAASSVNDGQADKVASCQSDCSEEKSEPVTKTKDDTEVIDGEQEQAQSDTKKNDSATQSDSPTKKEESSADIMEGAGTQEPTLTAPAE